VASPVATTTPRPPPAVITVPENTMLARSPSSASSATGSGCFSTAVDSPVASQLVLRNDAFDLGALVERGVHGEGDYLRGFHDRPLFYRPWG
jgi:hypothetical protein